MRKLTQEESRRLKETELEVLLEIKRVCTELGIDFFIESGTLLGAARHGGFIPWDDDIDMGMLRGDYERFLAEAQALLGDGYFLDCPVTNPGCLVPFAKVRKRGTLLLEGVSSGSEGCQGIWVDVLPWDFVDGDPAVFARMQKRWLPRRKLYGLRSVPSAASYASAAKKALRKLVHWALCVLPAERYREAFEGVAVPPQESGIISVTCLHYFRKLPNIKYSEAFPLTSLNFEGHEMPAFRCWEDYLKQAYGDWRTLPPEGKRMGHDIAEISFDYDKSKRTAME